MADHYVATVAIEAVTDAKPPAINGRGYPAGGDGTPRRVVDVVRIALSGDDLGRLIDQVQAHLSVARPAETTMAVSS